MILQIYFYPLHRLTGPHEIENFVGGSPVPLPTLTLGAESFIEL